MNELIQPFQDGEDSKGFESVRIKEDLSGHLESLETKRLGNCEVCAGKLALYTCPKCEVKTCSLSCCKIHKKELDCDGIRDRSKFISIKKMTENDFKSDYYFLEECTRYAADRKHDRLKGYTFQNQKLPKHLFHLKKACKDRNIKINFLLPLFSKRRENSSNYNWKLKKIFWHIEWVFVNAGNAKYTAKKCDEDQSLQKLLDRYLNPENLEDIPKKSLLNCYHSYDIYDMKILLKAECIKRSQSRFFLLDPSKSLKTNLKSKTILEFPTIYVTYEKDLEGFEIIDSDEDVEEETKAHQKTLDVIRNEFIEKQKQLSGTTEETEDIESKQLTKLATSVETKHEDRKRNLEEYEKTTNNFLFSDNKLIERLYSSSDDEEGNTKRIKR